MITTRPMRPGNEADLSWVQPPRPALWWWAHPTLVAETDDGRLVGYASFTISLPPTTALAAVQPREIGWGQGMAVHPDFQGQGIGKQLNAARVAVMRQLGLTFFIGHARPGHGAMIRLFTQHGWEAMVTCEQEDGTALTYYMGAL